MTVTVLSVASGVKILYREFKFKYTILLLFRSISPDNYIFPLGIM